MSYALERVACEMDVELKKYGIEVRGSDRIILFENQAIKLHPYTTSRECRRELNRLLKIAKDKARAAQLDNQVTLL